MTFSASSLVMYATGSWRAVPSRVVVTRHTISLPSL
jgi:hypothetical protein